MALEFRSNGADQRSVFLPLFYAFYRNPSDDKLLSNPEREFIARGEAQPEDRTRAAQGAPLRYLLRQRRVGDFALGFASYNYKLLFAAYLAAELSVHRSPHRLISFSDVHQRSLAHRHGNGFGHWRMAG